jgi:hypothetical protein
MELTEDGQIATLEDIVKTRKYALSEEEVRAFNNARDFFYELNKDPTLVLEAYDGDPIQFMQYISLAKKAVNWLRNLDEETFKFAKENVGGFVVDHAINTAQTTLEMTDFMPSENGSYYCGRKRAEELSDKRYGMENIGRTFRVILELNQFLGLDSGHYPVEKVNTKDPKFYLIRTGLCGGEPPQPYVDEEGVPIEHGEKLIHLIHKDSVETAIDLSLDANHTYEVQYQIFKGAIESAYERNLIPILVTSGSHKLSLPFYQALVDVTGLDLNIIDFDDHLDSEHNSYSSEAFWRHAIDTKKIDPTKLEIIGATTNGNCRGHESQEDYLLSQGVSLTEKKITKQGPCFLSLDNDVRLGKNTIRSMLWQINGQIAGAHLCEIGIVQKPKDIVEYVRAITA